MSTCDQATAFNRNEDDDIPALSREGLQITTDATIRFRIDPAQADAIFQTLGTDYENTLIRPQVRSVIRDRIAQYNAAEVISTQRTTPAGYQNYARTRTRAALGRCNPARDPLFAPLGVTYDSDTGERDNASHQR